MECDRIRGGAARVVGVNIGLTLLANSENTYAGLVSEDDETIESFLGSFLSRRLLTFVGRF